VAPSTARGPRLSLRQTTAQLPTTARNHTCPCRVTVSHGRPRSSPPQSPALPLQRQTPTSTTPPTSLPACPALCLLRTTTAAAAALPFLPARVLRVSLTTCPAMVCGLGHCNFYSRHFIKLTNLARWFLCHQRVHAAHHPLVLHATDPGSSAIRPPPSPPAAMEHVPHVLPSDAVPGPLSLQLRQRQQQHIMV
jgi:hypothetical protein